MFLSLLAVYGSPPPAVRCQASFHELGEAKILRSEEGLLARQCRKLRMSQDAQSFLDSLQSTRTRANISTILQERCSPILQLVLSPGITLLIFPKLLTGSRGHKAGGPGLGRTASKRPGIVRVRQPRACSHIAIGN